MVKPSALATIALCLGVISASAQKASDTSAGGGGTGSAQKTLGATSGAAANPSGTTGLHAAGDGGKGASLGGHTPEPQSNAPLSGDKGSQGTANGTSTPGSGHSE